MMEKEMFVDGQTLYFISDPGGSIARGYLVGPNRGIEVAQVMPWGKMIGNRSKSIVEDIDQNQRAARRLAAAWNATRHLSVDEIYLLGTGGTPLMGRDGKPVDGEADAIETDLTVATLPRSHVHRLLSRLQVVLG